MSRREDILQLAIKNLSLYGYNGFSYADLAKEIGIAKASLHYHFASKEILAINICDYIENIWQARFDELIAQPSTISALQKMTSFIQSNLSQLKHNRMCALATLLSNYESLPNPLQQRVYSLVAFEYSLYQHFIQQAVEEGELSSNINVDHCVTELISMIKGALIYRRIGHEMGHKFNDPEHLLSNLYGAWRKQ